MQQRNGLLLVQSKLYFVLSNSEHFSQHIHTLVGNLHLRKKQLFLTLQTINWQILNSKLNKYTWLTRVAE